MSNILTPGYLYWDGFKYVIQQITASLSGNLSGDVTGAPEDNTVVGIYNRPVSATAPTTGQVLEWTGSVWSPTTPNSAFIPNGDLSGNSLFQTVIGLYNRPISSATPSSGQVLEWNGSAWIPTTITNSSFSAGGDLSGTDTNQTVIRLNGNPILPTMPTLNQILEWNGSAWAPATVSSSFTAGGDLSGTDTNQTVIAIQGNPVSATFPTAGQFLIENSGANSSVWTSLSGDINASTSIVGFTTVAAIQNNPILSQSLGSSQDGYVLTWNGSDWSALPITSFIAGGDLSGTNTNQNVIAIYGASVPISGSLITGNVLQVNGASSLTYAPINVGGGSAFITGVMPAGNQANQIMGGDVTGTTAATTVVALQGNSISPQTLGSSQDGYVLTWNNSVNKWKAEPPITFVAGGDLSGTDTSQMVIGIYGVPINSTTPTSNQVLTYNGSEWTPEAVTTISGVTISGTPSLGQVLTATSSSAADWSTPTTYISALTQDVTASGSGSVPATVVQAQAGAIMFTSTGEITLANTDTNPVLGQLAQTTDIAVHNFTFAAQSAYTGATTNYTGASINLSPGTGATGSNSQSGSVNINLGTPSGAGNEAYFNVERGGSNYASIGGAIGQASTATALYMGPGLTSNSNNYTLLGDNAGNTTLNATSNKFVILSVNTDPYLTAYGSTGEVNIINGINFAVGPAYGVGGSYGGGVNVIGISPSTAPTSSPATGHIVLGSIVNDSGQSSLGIYDDGGSSVTLNAYGIAFAANSPGASISFAGSSTVPGTLQIAAQGSTGSNVGGELELIAGGAATSAIAGGPLLIQTGLAGTGGTNGALTITSGAGTSYTTSGAYSSGRTPGAWSWKAPGLTTSQSNTGITKNGLTTSGASFLFLPITINGVTVQIVCCV